GPTAVGKTNISIRLAQILGTEIISADSMQVYKHMDIGTAKPSQYEQSLVKHHMIDIIEPWEYFSAGSYVERIIPIIQELQEKNKRPVITGGTGLYMKTLTRGLFKGPSAVKEIRQRLLEIENNSQGSLYKRLCDVDPITALRINPNDTRRIIRALEVWEVTHKPIGILQKEKTDVLPYNFIKIGLTRNRDELYQIINQRVDKMIDDGLVDEVSRICEMILNKNTSQKSLTDLLSFTSMQAIGYKEVAGFLYSKDVDFKTVIDKIKQRTRNYAKRQMTWFRAESDIIWFNLSEKDEDDIIMEIKWTIDKRLTSKD
ncbi:MAG: tRNA (adenosine(37)-N6)-dimethylallyltransferase MiaA, partial [Thermodesulfovibrionales bacterium]|nr:tRNA (adenosine(37)-N6)-dimethylallyltransferase MiaA [Thermodesulfovibrionales bacterium]